MSLTKLESVICSICSVSTHEKAKAPPGLGEKIASIKQAFQDYWRDEHLPLAESIVKVIDGGAICVVSPL